MKSQEMWRDTDFRIKDSQLNGNGCVYVSVREKSKRHGGQIIVFLGKASKQSESELTMGRERDQSR